VRPSIGTPDVSVPSVARVWDYLFDGKDNFKVDRDAVGQMCEAFHSWRTLARMQRRFVCRAVEWLVGEAGISQLIEVGCVFPQLVEVHDIALHLNPIARVVYVDNDPAVFSHANAHSLGNRSTAAIQADVAAPAAILQHPAMRGLLDLDRPYAVLLCGVIHHLRDDAGAPLADHD
jgi:hypothetical protein